jgi:phenylacetate-CoA ligase
MTTLSTILRATNRYRALLRSQYWSAEKLRAYTHRALDETLRAAVQIPFYAARWDGSPGPPDLSKLPTVRRCEIGALNDSVLRRYPNGADFSSHSSSGSTGMPTEFYFDDRHQIGRLAGRMRYLRAHGWNPLKRTVWLLYFVFRTEHNEDERLMRSRFRMASHFIEATPELDGKAEELSKLDPTFLYTFPSYLEILLNRLAETGRRLPSLKRIFTGAEVLEDSLRQRAKKDLGVEIAENYGSTEAFMAWECPAGNRHINAEHVLIEIVDESGRAVAPGQIGKVVVTTLENRLAPLVRYEIGDYAVAAEGGCECGRTLPLIGKIVGRGMNLFRRGAGELISPWHLSSAVRSRDEVKQFQIVQTSLGQFTLRYIADDALIPEAEETIRKRFQAILGDAITVGFQRVREIPRTAGGKYMTALSELPE